jgi:hypothetical protein
MSGELHQASELQANIYMAMREHVCTTLCPGGRKCMNQKCISAFFGVTSEIKSRLETMKPEEK